MNNPIIMTYKNQHLGLNGSDDSEEERSMHAAFIFEDRQHCNHLDSLSYKNDISSENEKVISMFVFKMHPYLLTTVCNYHTFVQFFPHSVTFSSPVSPEKDGFLLFFRFISRWHYLQHMENSERFDTWTLWKAINKQKIVGEQNSA